jgi:ribosomal protein L4
LSNAPRGGRVPHAAVKAERDYRHRLREEVEEMAVAFFIALQYKPYADVIEEFWRDGS